MNHEDKALHEKIEALGKEVATMRSTLETALGRMEEIQAEFANRHDDNKARDETALGHILSIAKKIEVGASHRNAVAIQDSRRSLSTLTGVIVAVLLAILIWTTALDDRSRRSWAGRLFPVFAGLSIGGIGLLIYSRMGGSEAYQQALTTALQLPDPNMIVPPEDRQENDKPQPRQ